MFLEKEENKAINVYHKITFMESGAVMRIQQLLILCNLLLLILFVRDKMMTENSITIRSKFFLIGFEIIVIILFRIDDFNFNKLLKNGVVLKTIIEQKYSRVQLGASRYRLFIHSYYVCDDETRLVFVQSKEYYVNKKFFDFTGLYSAMIKKLESETYINVIVNSQKCSKYYMMISEIGVPETEKYDVPYAKKKVNIILTILLVLEYIAFGFL